MVLDFKLSKTGDICDINRTTSFGEELLGSFVDAKYLAPSRVTGWYVITEDNLTVSFKVDTDIQFVCDRCLEPTAKTISFEVSEVFFEKGKSPDPEAITYENDVIDLTELMEERFLLALPMTVLCKSTCKGLCPKCGTNLNVSQCDCTFDTQIDESERKENPFAILKDRI